VGDARTCGASPRTAPGEGERSYQRLTLNDVLGESVLEGVCDESVVMSLNDIGPLLDGVCVVPGVLLVNAPVV
jgi:hypothetical protein